MKTTDTSAPTDGTTRPGRPNLKEAARQVAAAFGLKICFGKNTYPPGERLAYRWACKSESSGKDWEMELLCLPAVWGMEGWMGCIKIHRYGERDLLDRWFVSFDEHIYGRKASKLTRERFCAWAATLTPGSCVKRGGIEAKAQPVEVI